MVRVYRVEHPKSGRGPFTHQDDDLQTQGDIRRGLDYAYRWYDNDPWPSLWNDWPEWAREGKNSYEYYCGVRVLDQVHHWFDEAVRKVLERAGYHLYVYEVPEEDVVFGKSGKQVFFKRANARIVEEERLCA